MKVIIEPEYLPDQSKPDELEYVWLYHVIIENDTNKPIKLLSRYWHIIDGKGIVQEVTGDGVVGKQPVIEPSDSYTYTSSVVLNYMNGIMHGKYFFCDASEFSVVKNTDTIKFNVDIPVFSLDSLEQILLAN